MRSDKIKIGGILLSTAGLILAVVCGYALLRYALTVALGFDIITIEAWDAYIPALLSLTLYIIFFRRLKAEQRARQRKIEGKEFASLLLAIMTFTTLYYSQQYVVYQFRKTLQLSDISQIEPSANRYEIERFKVNPNISASCFHMEKWMAKGKPRIIYSAYFVFQFADAPRYWFVQKYTKRFHYGVFTTDDEIRSNGTSFANDLYQELSRLNFNSYHTFNRVRFSNDKIGYSAALRNVRDIELSEQEMDNAIFLEPLYSDTKEDSSSYCLNVTLLSLLGGFVLIALLFLFSKSDEKIAKPAKSKFQRGGDSMRDILKSILLPDKSSWSLTLVLSALIGCFLYLMLFGESQLSPFWQWCAVSGQTLEQGEWRRVFTHIFVPDEVLDVIGWMAAIFMTLLTFSAHKTVLIVIISGAVAGAVTAFNQELLYVGSSGATMGLCGAVLAVCALYKKERNGIYALLIAVMVFAIMTGLMGYGITSHITGFGVGAVLGVLLHNQSLKLLKRTLGKR